MEYFTDNPMTEALTLTAPVLAWMDNLIQGLYGTVREITNSGRCVLKEMKDRKFQIKVQQVRGK